MLKSGEGEGEVQYDIIKRADNDESGASVARVVLTAAQGAFGTGGDARAIEEGVRSRREYNVILSVEV